MATKTQRPEPHLPPGFADALDHDPRANRRFEGLTPSQRARCLEPITTAGESRIRESRIAFALAALRAP